MTKKIFTVEIENCNNITSSSLSFLKSHLNINYAMNGSGKSTVAKVIKAISTEKSLEEYKPFGTNLKPNANVSEKFNNVLLFNDDFVNNFIFKESEVISNSFEIFIKTDNYDQKLEALNKRLKELKIDIGKDEDINNMLKVFTEIKSKISLNTKKDSLKKNPFVKAITSKENIYNIPSELTKFTKFLEDGEHNINWIHWKNKGSDFDSLHDCPFCAEELSEAYEKEKESFSNTYKKTSAKSTKDMLDYFEKLKPYINNEKYDVLIECVKFNKNPEDTEFLLKQFIGELSYLKEKIEKSVSFDSHSIKSEEITNLDEVLNRLKIEIKGKIDVFNSEKSKRTIETINHKLDALLVEIEALKEELGTLKGIIESKTKDAISDINSFLNQAGINYEIFISPTSQAEANTVLRYVVDKEKSVDIKNIRNHLSWGEKNAFALILFMYYAIRHKADLIILDDPVSSFDSNKKYAIINRIFKNKNKSFYNKTVILFTHDFQPIIDFFKINKKESYAISPKYLKNNKGKLLEFNIEKKNIKSALSFLNSGFKNDSISIIHRIVFLRKYIEYKIDDSANSSAYNILSSLIHGESQPKKKIRRDVSISLTSEENNDGIGVIKTHLPDFDYKLLIGNFSQENLLKLYSDEKSSYLKLQIFRVYIGIGNKRGKLEDDTLLKFINEIFHIENDYIYCLDFLKFDTVPSHIISRCDNFMSSISLESE